MQKNKPEKQTDPQKEKTDELKKWADFLSDHRNFLTATELATITGLHLDWVLEHTKKQRWKLGRYRNQAEAMIRQHAGIMPDAQLCQLMCIEQAALTILIKAFRDKDKPPKTIRMAIPR
jgi:hypothetical protein